MVRYARLFSLVFATQAIFVTHLHADSFRVETEVFIEEDREPVVETLTVFSGDVVYDFQLGTERETTVFDVRRGRIVLLDATRQIKSTVKTEALAEFTAAIQARAAQADDPGLFRPEFELEEAGPDQFALVSPSLIYRVQGRPSKHPAGAEQFRMFADWYARLNALRPPNVPPFGRIELNRALAERNLLPQEIERTTVTNRRLVVRSVHTVNWILSNTDAKRIEKAARQLAEFREVKLVEYWGASDLATAGR